MEKIDFEKFGKECSEKTIENKSGIKVKLFSALKKLHDSNDLQDFARKVTTLLEQIDLTPVKLEEPKAINGFKGQYRVDTGLNENIPMFEPNAKEQAREINNKKVIKEETEIEEGR